jgi:SAM-dependent methyltransferase/uncharacterized protein YbaR (Trm112 family)
MIEPLDPWLESRLVCPRDLQPLRRRGDDQLECEQAHSYPIISGVPVLLRYDIAQTIGIAERSLAAAREPAPPATEIDALYIETLGINEQEMQGVAELARRGSAIDPVVSFMVGATNGYMYTEAIGALTQYPIPVLRMPPGQGRTLLDIGCNWGRWSIAAARLGYLPIGIDPSLGAVLAAKRVTQELGLKAHFCVADGRHLPFAPGSFDNAFSYSVLQHMSAENVTLVLRAVRRVLKSGGQALVQMPNKYGVRCLYHQVRRRFREPRDFEVRYWRLGDLAATFETEIGPSEISVDCFFGLGLQASDAHMMPPAKRALIHGSEALRHISGLVPPLSYAADSVYVRATRA